MKLSIKLLAVIFICMNIISCTLSPQITMNPYKDAQTCIKLYKSNVEKGQEYMDNVTTTYYIQGERSNLDKFLEIVTEEITTMSFQ